MRQASKRFSGVILDVDGVIWIGGAPSEGAAAFLETLREETVPFCLLTNDCNSSKAERHKTLIQAGLPLREDQLVMAADVTRHWLKEAALETIMYLGAPSTLPDVAKGLRVRDSSPVDAVVVGDLFANYDRCFLDRAAKAVTEGAALIAMQRNAVWSDGKDWYVDNGFWVAGFEFVTGHKAIVMGKPNRGAYMTAVARLGQLSHDYSRTAFVSDDIAVDLKGAKDVGLTTVYFGPARILRPWVDYSACDMAALSAIVLGRDYD